jgi:hypothetical protein
VKEEEEEGFKRIGNQGVTVVTRLWVSMTESLGVSNWMVHSSVLGHIILLPVYG